MKYTQRLRKYITTKWLYVFNNYRLSMLSNNIIKNQPLLQNKMVFEPGFILETRGRLKV